MKVLVACEESQVVCKAFRERGHEAYSCDVQECSGGHPEWHIHDDVIYHLNEGWDLMIAHPPCTYLTVAANRVYLNNPERWRKRLDALLFVKKLLDAPIHRIALENPIGAISTHIRKPDQIIQPYHHGHKDSKATCLWLKNLPWLYPTEAVVPEWITSTSGKRHSKTHWQNPSTNNPDNTRLRAKTYDGIARAMAEQWSELLTQPTTV
jgi:hypothetical protein